MSISTSRQMDRILKDSKFVFVTKSFRVDYTVRKPMCIDALSMHHVTGSPTHCVVRFEDQQISLKRAKLNGENAMRPEVGEEYQVEWELFRVKILGTGIYKHCVHCMNISGCHEEMKEFEQHCLRQKVLR